MFENDIQIKLSKFNNGSIPYETLTKVFIKTFNLYAPLKKYSRANLSKFISKEFSKEIMLRSKSGHKILNKTNETRIKYRRQCNVCVHLLPRAKRNYYNDLENTKRITETQRIMYKNILENDRTTFCQ